MTRDKINLIPIDLGGKLKLYRNTSEVIESIFTKTDGDRQK